MANSSGRKSFLTKLDLTDTSEKPATVRSSLSYYTLTADFIKTGFETIVGNWAVTGLLDSILTLYVLYFLYQVKFYNTPISDATVHLIKVCMVFLVATNWNVFYILIFDVFTNEPLHIMKLLLSGHSAGDGSLNNTFVSGIEKAIILLANMPFTPKGIACSIIAAALLIAGTFLFTVVALTLIVISKFYLAVFLAIAPYFLLMFLFNGTKGLSESWLKSTLNYALIPLFIGCVLLLTQTLANACLNTSSSFGKSPSSPEFIGILLYLFCALISAFLLKTIPEKCASLTSSLAMAGAGRMANYAQNLGSKASTTGGMAKKGFNSAKNNFAQRQQKLQQEIGKRAEDRNKKESERHAKNWRGGIY